MVAKKRTAKRKQANSKERQQQADADSRAASKARSLANLKHVKSPPFKPTKLERRQAQVMKSMGWPDEKICKIIRDGIDVKTLVKHFKHELAAGAEMTDAAITGTMYKRAAIDGDVGALKWWTAARMGWRDKDPDVNPFAGATVNIHKSGKKPKPKEKAKAKKKVSS